MLVLLTLFSLTGNAQNCPANTPATISSNPDTYYPGIDPSVATGVKSIKPGAAGAPGKAGLLIQNVTKAQTPNQFLYCSLLPVHFTGIAAKWQQKNVLISWQVNNGDDINTYSIEKNSDGINFNTIDVAAANSGAIAAGLYSYTDLMQTTTSKVLYYRIKAISTYGSILYSNITSVSNSQNNAAAITVYPNPVINSSAGIKITVSSPSGGNVVLRLISITGHTVWQKQYAAVAGINNIVTDNAQAFTNGIYFLQYYNDNNKTVTTKIVISQ